MSLVGFSAKNHPQQTRARGALDDKDDRRTLPELFDPLHAEHGFTLDVAASRENAKLARYFSLAEDGLKQSWAGEIVWCNPPFSNLFDWVDKAIHEVFYGECRKVVMLLPANRCEQRWWQHLIEPYRDRGGSAFPHGFFRDVRVSAGRRIVRGRRRGTAPRSVWSS